MKMKILDEYTVVTTEKRYRLDCESVIIRHTHKQEPNVTKDSYLLVFDYTGDVGELTTIHLGCDVRLMRPGYRKAFKKIDPFFYHEDGSCLFDDYCYSDEELDKELHFRIQGGHPITEDELVLDGSDNLLYDVRLRPVPAVISFDPSFMTIDKLVNPTGYFSHLKHHPWILNKDKLGPIYDPMTGTEYWANKETGYLEIMLDDLTYVGLVNSFNKSDDMSLESYMKRKDVMSFNRYIEQDEI